MNEFKPSKTEFNVSIKKPEYLKYERTKRLIKMLNINNNFLFIFVSVACIRFPIKKSVTVENKRSTK